MVSIGFQYGIFPNKYEYRFCVAVLRVRVPSSPPFDAPLEDSGLAHGRPESVEWRPESARRAEGHSMASIAKRVSCVQPFTILWKGSARPCGKQALSGPLLGGPVLHAVGLLNVGILLGVRHPCVPRLSLLFRKPCREHVARCHNSLYSILLAARRADSTSARAFSSGVISRSIPPSLANAHYTQ